MRQKTGEEPGNKARCLSWLLKLPLGRDDVSFVVTEDKFCVEVVVVGSGDVSLGSGCWLLAAGGEEDGGVPVGDMAGLRSAGGLEEGVRKEAR